MKLKRKVLAMFGYMLLAVFSGATAIVLSPSVLGAQNSNVFFSVALLLFIYALLHATFRAMSFSFEEDGETAKSTTVDLLAGSTDFAAAVALGLIVFPTEEIIIAIFGAGLLFAFAHSAVTHLGSALYEISRARKVSKANADIALMAEVQAEQLEPHLKKVEEEKVISDELLADLEAIFSGSEYS